MKRQKEPRHHTISISLSDREIAAIDAYVELFQGKGRAPVVRECCIRYVMDKLIDKRSELHFEDEEEATEVSDVSRERKSTHGYASTPSLFSDKDLNDLINTTEKKAEKPKTKDLNRK